MLLYWLSAISPTLKKSAITLSFDVHSFIHQMFLSLKSSLYRLRQQCLPPMPTTREKVHFCGEWAKTDAGENFLLVEDGQGDEKIIIFSTVYLRALEIIKQKTEDLGYTLAPVEVLTDFELAIIQAVELTFPTTEVKGCSSILHKL